MSESSTNWAGDPVPTGNTASEPSADMPESVFPATPGAANVALDSDPLRDAIMSDFQGDVYGLNTDALLAVLDLCDDTPLSHNLISYGQQDMADRVRTVIAEALGG